MTDADQKLLDSLRKADKQVCDKIVMQITQLQKKYQEQIEVIGDLNASCAMISDIQHQLQDEQLQFKQSEKGMSSLQILQQIYSFVNKSDDLIVEVSTELVKRDLLSAPNTIQKYIDFLEEEKSIFKQLGQIDEIPAVQLSLKQLKESCQKLIEQTAELITKKVSVFIDDPNNQKITRFSEMMENIFEELQMNQIAFITLRHFNPSQYQKLRRNLLQDLNQYFRNTVHNHLNNEIAKFQFVKYNRERLNETFLELNVSQDSVFNKNKCYDMNFAEGLDGKRICKLKVSPQTLKNTHTSTSVDTQIYLLFLYYVMFSCAIIQSMNQLFDKQQQNQHENDDQQVYKLDDEDNIASNQQNINFFKKTSEQVMEDLKLDSIMNQPDETDIHNRSEIPDFVAQDYTFNYTKVQTVQEAVLAVLGGSIEAEDFFQVRNPDSRGVFRQIITTLLENQALSSVFVLQAFHGVEQLAQSIANFHQDFWIIPDVFRKVCGFILNIPTQRLDQLNSEIENQGKQCQSNIYKSGILQLSQHASLLLFNIGTNAIYCRQALNFQECFPKESDKLQQIIKSYVLQDINSGINICDYKLNCYELQEKQQNGGLQKRGKLSQKNQEISELQAKRKQLLVKKFKKEKDINAVFENTQNAYYQTPIFILNGKQQNDQSIFDTQHSYFSNPVNIQLLQVYYSIINKSTNSISETTGQIKDIVKQKYLPLTTSMHLYFLNSVFNMIIPIQHDSSDQPLQQTNTNANSPNNDQIKKNTEDTTLKQLLAVNQEVQQVNQLDDNSQLNETKQQISNLLEQTMELMESELTLATRRYIYNQLEYNCSWFIFLQQIRQLLAKNYTEADVPTQKGFQVSNFEDLIDKMQKPQEPAKSEYALILMRILKQIGGLNTQQIIQQLQNNTYISEMREKYKEYLYEQLIKTIKIEFQEFRDITKRCYYNKLKENPNINVNDIIQALESQKSKFLTK